LSELEGIVLSLNPDFLSLSSPRDTDFPIASVCFHDALHTLQEATYALSEVFAHRIWYLEKKDHPDKMCATFFGRFYADDAALRLYSAGEHLANGIIMMLEITDEDLKPYKVKGKQGKERISPQEFFIIEDVTALVNGAAIGLDDTIAAMFKAIASPECPTYSLSPKCRDPRDCPLSDDCHSSLPDHNVISLYRGKQAGYSLLSQGVQCIKDIPAGSKLSANQNIQKECILTNAPYIDREALQTFLGSLKYPISYFDFETINPGIPLCDGMRPYQKIPFQFSLVIVPAEGAQPQQSSFLAKTANDPRPALLAEMKRRIPDGGSIVVYNKGFEGPILKQLGESFPGYREWLDGLATRLEDLWDPFKKFHYYHPKQRGSTSIKHVLPALTGRSYEGMEIADGETASVLYWNVTHRPASETERQKVYDSLEEYCGLDTDGMRSIVNCLRSL